MKTFKDTPVADFALKTPKLLVVMYLCMKVNIYHSLFPLNKNALH